MTSSLHFVLHHLPPLLPFPVCLGSASDDSFSFFPRLSYLHLFFYLQYITLSVFNFFWGLFLLSPDPSLLSDSLRYNNPRHQFQLAQAQLWPPCISGHGGLCHVKPWVKVNLSSYVSSVRNFVTLIRKSMRYLCFKSIFIDFKIYQKFKSNIR